MLKKRNELWHLESSLRKPDSHTNSSLVKPDPCTCMPACRVWCQACIPDLLIGNSLSYIVFMNIMYVREYIYTHSTMASVQTTGSDAVVIAYSAI